MKCPNLRCLHTLEGSPEACPACGLPLPGALLGGRFRLEGIESAIQSAVSFLARDGAARVSVRVFLPAQGHDQAVQAMEHEIRAVEELGSGRMPRLLAHDLAGPLPWIAFEATGWEKAERHLEARERPLGENELLHVLDEIARTVAPLHDKGIAHRGIRSEAIYLRDAGGQIALGLPAWEADLERVPDPGPEGAASDFFRSPYEAPEYLPGRATPRTDMYALGVMALRLLTGLRGPNLASAARNLSAQTGHFGLTRGGFEILCALLAENAARRVSSGGQLLELLGKLDPAHDFGPGPGSARMAGERGALRKGDDGHERHDQHGVAARTGSGAAARTGSGVADGTGGAAGGTGDGAAAGTGGSVAAGTEDGAAAGTGGSVVAGTEDGAAGGTTPKERKAHVVRAALLAALTILLTSFKQVLGRSATQPDFSIKLLVALGLSGAIAAVGPMIVARQPLAADGLGRSPMPHSLPRAIVGHDDRPAAAEPDASLWAKALALLPRVPVATMQPDRPVSPGHGALVPGGRWPPEGQAGRPGASAFSETVASGAAPIPTRGEGARPAGLTSMAGVEAPSRQSRREAGSTPSRTDASTSGNGLAAAPAQGRMSPSSPGPDGPYDPIAEPGTDPEDVSGLTRQSRYFIRVNKTYKTLTLYLDGKFVAQYAVAIGAGASTPDGRYTIRRKIAHPSYENIPPGDSRNPLGTRWLGLDVRFPGGGAIGIHGTNDGSSIGQAVSGGCIRMRNADAEQLYDLVPEGTPVEIN